MFAPELSEAKHLQLQLKLFEINISPSLLLILPKSPQGPYHCYPSLLSLHGGEIILSAITLDFYNTESLSTIRAYLLLWQGLGPKPRAPLRQPATCELVG